MEWQLWFQRNKIVSNLEKFQDFIVVSLCIGLFCVILIRLGEMFFSLLQPLNFKAITADILFILILVELFRLLIVYLQQQRISVGAAVEVSLVSALREVVVDGVLEIPLEKLLGVCAVLNGAFAPASRRDFEAVASVSLQRGGPPQRAASLLSCFRRTFISTSLDVYSI